MRFEKFAFKDINGKEIKSTCDESKLGNNFGANSGKPHFLTTIFFKKEVLDKYYGRPSKYSINDGYLFYVRENGVNEWGMPIDNNAKECVMAYLGDLGKIPYEEQQHWKLHNILEGKSSLVSFKRDFKVESCSPTEPALFFKEKLEIFNENWRNKFRWSLFRQLDKGDEHHFKSLRVPGNEQKEFDELVLSLNKIIIDSLNVVKMKQGLTFEKNDKSISVLDKFLQQKFKWSSPQLIYFLRNLQDLRSTGSAHGKGESYKRAYKKFDKSSFSKTFENILIGAITLLNTLEKLCKASRPVDLAEE